MRLWSLHPQYLDSKGLVALWREALLAKKVLEGKTKGYKNHPQLERFKATDSPLEYIHLYLHLIFTESRDREFVFDVSKINLNYIRLRDPLPVTRGQIEYEARHLLRKLKHRNSDAYRFKLSDKDYIEPHPLFYVIEGDIESWEKVK